MKAGVLGEAPDEAPNEAPSLREGALSLRDRALKLREQALDLREKALGAAEDCIALREAASGPDQALMQTRAERLAERARQTRDANERLVIASLRAQALADAAEEANKLKDDFLAMLSHELRNPLAPIRNAAAILKRVSHAESRLPWIHGVIERQIEQMTRLLDDLLDVARVRSGKIVLLRRTVTAREFIEQAVETCRPFAEGREQQLTVELPDETIHLDGDPVRLTQVFANLLNNAAKYTGRGGAIAVQVQADEQTLVVRVRDNGSGLAPESLTRIFELFRQEDRSLAHAQGGLGIGLTVVRRLVELHGGTVEAFSAGLNCGSEFVVTLPRLHPPVAVPMPPAAALPQRHLRIVVIEDNHDANETLCTLLRLVGHEVLSAYDGTTGVALVLDSLPQIVLCDIGLPGMDGLAVAERLRERMPAPLPLLVAVSGYGLAEDRYLAERAGFGQHLTKPVNTEALLSIIDLHAAHLAGTAD